MPTAASSPGTGPQLKPTLPPLTVTAAPPPPTKHPDEPYRTRSLPLLPPPDTAYIASVVDQIVIGTVREVLPSRWTTTDGTRPPNPHAGPPFYHIFTPVRIGVEVTFKGSGSGGEVLLYLPGGQIGMDASIIDHSFYAPFQPGERTVLFLSPARPPQTELGGVPLWSMRERYTIKGDRAERGARTLPLQELVAEIEAAVAASPKPVGTPTRP